MNDEILAGIKNAVEHGSSIESAVQSFINAGYNAEDVREVSEYISKGSKPLPVQKDEAKPAETMPKKESDLALIIVLIIILLALLLLEIFGLVFKNEILSVLS